MVLRSRYGWGYETLVRAVADSLHLRCFCVIALGAAMPGAHQDALGEDDNSGYGGGRDRT